MKHNNWLKRMTIVNNKDISSLDINISLVIQTVEDKY